MTLWRDRARNFTDESDGMTQLRVLRKSFKRYDRMNDREYFENHDQLQYSAHGDNGMEWVDVPIVYEQPSNNTEVKDAKDS